jgi:hypothetical protein
VSQVTAHGTTIFGFTATFFEIIGCVPAALALCDASGREPLGEIMYPA